MRFLQLTFAVIIIIVTVAFSSTTTPLDQIRTSTFSIVAYDPETHEWGVAVASRVLAVGYIVPWAKADVGAIATQALANMDYGVLGLNFLEKNYSAKDALEALLTMDKDREERQVAIVDRNGDVAAFTGSKTMAWSGNKSGEHYSVQGNILVGEQVLSEMVKAYEGTQGPLARRMLEAIKAGDAAGGDKRGRQSAAMLVVKERGGYQGRFDRLVDIKVDDATEPIKELERIYNLWEPNFMVAVYLDAAGAKEKEYALGMMERMLANEKDANAEVYNAFAWELAIRKLYPDRAIEIALKANQLDPAEPNIMDTVAEAYYAAGDYQKAVDWEKEALKKDPSSEIFQQQLEKYKKAREGKP
jgi:uncharacterized Ntn-hydrolase superfamily protein